MTASNLLRWAGLAAVLGGALFVVSNLLLINIDYDNFSEEVTTGTFTAHTVLFGLAALLFLLGLVGLYVRQSEATGALGLLGFLLAFIGTAFVLGLNWSETFVLPILAQVAPEMVAQNLPGRILASFMASFWLFIGGWLLFAIATLKGHVYPRAPSVLLMIGAVALITNLVLPGIGGMVFGVAVAWLGLALFTGRGVAAALESPRVS